MNKRALCFGLEPYPLAGYTIDHFPLIEIVPLPWKSGREEYSHLLFTSKTAVKLFPPSEKPVLAIGKGTAKEAKQKGFRVEKVAAEETQEGVCALVSTLESASILWPRSDQARPVLANFCREAGIRLVEIPVYTVASRKVALPNFSNYDALFFTSPSTVDAFFALDPHVPSSIEFVSIGPVTREKVEKSRLSLH